MEEQIIMKKSSWLWSVFFVFVLILTTCGGGGGSASAPSPVTPVTSTSSVTYDGNGNTGGSVPTDTTNYAQGQVVTVPGNPGNLVKAQFTFVGWNTASGGSGTNNAQGQTFPMGSANVTLYARWASQVPCVTCGVNWPLRRSANGPYLEDQSGIPFVIIGDAAWSLAAQV